MALSEIKPIPKSLQKKLLSWFEANKRDLPWRRTKDPYAIWVSEVLLQQTTSQAVIPYYKRFLKKFSNISSLAQTNKRELFPLWSGLGYYKRAENLIRAAKKLQRNKTFPRSYKELLKLPGFGPYISRAVSSLAFEEPVGVLDGNVLRFLSRFHALPLKRWKAKDRAELQLMSDLWVKNQPSSKMNQALMEIGSLICRSKNPLCLLCPVLAHCQSRKKGLIDRLPVQPAKKPVEFWLWKPEKIKKNVKWAFVKNTSLPFLKGRLIFPGEGKKLPQKAKRYDFTHSIMSYKIFVRAQNQAQSRHKSLKWLTKSQIKRINPSSLIQKVLDL